MTICLIYVTFETLDEARRIGEDLVTRKLVACANIMPGMTSIYEWHGEINVTDEVLMLAKTTQANAQAVVDEIKRLHRYDEPAIVVLPITGGSAGYLDWVQNQVYA